MMNIIIIVCIVKLYCNEEITFLLFYELYFNLMTALFFISQEMCVGHPVHQGSEVRQLGLVCSMQYVSVPSFP